MALLCAAYEAQVLYDEGFVSEYRSRRVQSTAAAMPATSSAKDRHIPSVVASMVSPRGSKVIRSAQV